jgi:ribosomal protein S18 acetylase RimI-like enzyme
MHCLRAITSLLRRTSAKDRLAALYEPADLEWWWREDCVRSARNQAFWFEIDEPAAALLIFHCDDEWDCTFFALPSLEQQTPGEIIPDVMKALAGLPGPSVVTVREEDSEFRQALEAGGWRASGEALVQTCLEECIAEAQPLPEGFSFEVRALARGRPHPMTQQGRNSKDIESRLAELPLYRSDLDYAVIDPSNQVAAYALFWMDRTTNVGLIEPIRTEEAFQQRGLGLALLSEGVMRLQRDGAEIVKVSYNEGNEAARKLYRRCGFRDLFRKLKYRKNP